jgi:lipoprotein-anchoring transpeptidase ErfK/SrfK
VGNAGVVAQISLSQQRVVVSVDGAPTYSWPVSTARRGYVTPTGSYRPYRTARMWYSRKYDMSPTPYSVFFRGGYAIHGTGYLRSLGRPASHGCVRLHPRAAATFYDLAYARHGQRAHRDHALTAGRGVSLRTPPRRSPA